MNIFLNNMPKFVYLIGPFETDISIFTTLKCYSVTSLQVSYFQKKKLVNYF